MGKIVKYCGSCEESFAEKFSFCPNCAQPLTAFEMNPVSGAASEIAANITPLIENNQTTAAEKFAPMGDKFDTVSNDAPETITEEVAPEPESSAPVVSETPVIEPIAPIAAEKFAESASEIETPISSFDQISYNAADSEALNDANDEFDEPAAIADEDDYVVAPKTYAATAGAGANQPPLPPLRSNLNSSVKSPDDDGFHITVIEEKNGKQRNALLLGTLVLMTSLALGGMVYSIFNKDMGIGAIDSDNPLLVGVIDEVPPVEIEKPPPPKKEKEGGGGGGGGNKNPDPVTKGEPPTQVAKPVAPLMMVPKMTNPAIKIVNQTQGTIVRPPTDKQVGLPNGLTSDRLSSGNGTGGGFGNGRGSGAGNGIGTGEGNGKGSGSGNGDGNGNGNGKGDGSSVRTPPPPPPPAPVGPTEALKILSRPQPKYTDAARQNQVTGTVTLKVTFTANGQIGSIAPVSGLPYGLTEQAIAAARQIRFEPPKRNGVPYAVSKTVTYTFTIY